MPDATLLKERLAEAARYALLRRLAPAIRHNMAGALQPISMVAAMMERRMQSPTPDMAVMAKNSNALNTLSREAASACMGLMTWLAPKDIDAAPVGREIEESVGLVATELSFKGFGLVNQATGIDTAVPRSVVRNVFMASLLALTDAAETPGELTLSADNEGDGVVLTIALVPKQGGPAVGGASHAYRHLAWDDVQALADVDGVRVQPETGRVRLWWKP